NIDIKNYCIRYFEKYGNVILND
uniref:N-acetylmuramoyl-L-alanine amidase n=1 Tax=Parastrongyloides trichosuri TaxID=131310 RepID=A0A0N4ZW68_PARTI